MTAATMLAAVAAAWFGLKAQVDLLVNRTMVIEGRTTILETQREREREERANGLAAIATLKAQQEAMLLSQQRVERTLEQLLMQMRRADGAPQQPGPTPSFR